MKIKAKITRQVYANGNYRIFGCVPIGESRNIKLNQYGNFTIKGEYPYLTEGREYELVIEEMATDNYGTSYKVLDVPSLTMESLEDLSRDAKFEILMDCTSSSRIANNILDAYPNFIELILTEGRESIDVSKIKGVGEAYLSAYARELNEKYKYYAFIQKYKMYELTISECKLLFDKYVTDKDIEKALESNPYKVLIQVVGRSYNRVDKMLCELKPELKDSDQRLEALMLEILRRNEVDGSTRLFGNTLFEVAKDPHEYGFNEDLLRKNLKRVAVESEDIYFDEETRDLARMDTYMAECNIFDFVMTKLHENNKLDIDYMKYASNDNFTLTEQQSQALKMFCEYPISLLVGYSGTGKTTTVKSLIDLCEDNGMSYTLLAPTGAASLRIEESTNRPSSTIHRKCLSSEISTDVLIADEESMTDLETFWMMLKAIDNPKIRIVLVGDDAQLLPVGKGCVFSDMITSNMIPKTMLTEVFRYSSNGALFAATNIRQGKEFFDSDEDIVKKTSNGVKIGDNYEFKNCPESEILEKVKEEYLNLINKGVLPKDILVLSPFNVLDSGTYRINNEIQSEVNPPLANETTVNRKIKNVNITFRKGSRIINKQNDYDMLTLEAWEQMENDELGVLSEDDVPHTQVFNGQRGIVTSVDDKKLVAQFGEELLVFPKLKAMNNLLLGYSITAHASQGSEALYVISVVCPSHKKMLNRNLLYVADTRAKIKHLDIGDMDTFNSALKVDGIELRHTWLKSLLESQKDSLDK